MTSCLDLPAPSTCQPTYILVWSLRRPVFLINSHSSRFPATAQPFFVSQAGRHPLSRSYGVNLPSSFTRVLSSALGYAPRLPVSVLVRAPDSLPAGIFSETGPGDLKTPKDLQAPPPTMTPRIFLRLGLGIRTAIPSAVTPSQSRPPSDQRSSGGVRILTHCPSPTPFGLSLGPD